MFICTISVNSKYLVNVFEMCMLKVSGPNLVTYLNRTLILSWLGVDLRMDTKITCV